MEGAAKPNDEFEFYFQKAAAAHNLNLERLKIDDNVHARRVSLPDSVRRIQLEEGVGDNFRRASSFKKTPTIKANGSFVSHAGTPPNSSSDVQVACYSGSNSSCLLSPNTCAANLKSTSAPQSRSGSFKKLTKPRSIRDFQEMHVDYGSAGDQRRVSINLEEMVASKLQELKKLENDNCCVVRSFVTSPKGIVSQGDSFKRKTDNSKSAKRTVDGDSGSHSTDFAVSLKVPCVAPTTAKVQTGVPLTRALSHERPNNILIMGDRRVGKTSLVTQFMTSDYLAGLDTSFENELENEKTISVLVNDVETMLNFIDVDICAQEDHEARYRERGVACYVIVYSITERSSFNFAINLVSQVCYSTGQTEKKPLQRTYAVILVANKGDLVRKRQVSESEARDICNQTKCKYIEVSAGLNHRVDDLLVGIVSQVRLNTRREEMVMQMKTSSDATPAANYGTTQDSKTTSYLGMLKRFFGFRSKDSQICENMQTL